MADANAPGWPGIPPRWTSSAKSGLGTALGGESRVWFTYIRPKVAWNVATGFMPP
jgi:hypothetical protein